MKILIIGGTSGIGFYVAEKLSKRNHKVIICTHKDKQRIVLEEKIKRKKLDIDVYKLDVCNKDDLELLNKIKYDVIWLNQAIGIGGAILSVKEEKMREIYETNVFGTVLALQKSYKNMINNNIAGKIIVTSSQIANVNLAYLGMYASTKAALTEICYTINKELMEIKSDISITMLELGAYHTGFNQVMIDNKETSQEESQFYQINDKITKRQKLLFTLIEKNNYDDICQKIIKLIETKNNITRIRTPILQAILIKIYSIIMR